MLLVVVFRERYMSGPYGVTGCLRFKTLEKSAIREKNSWKGVNANASDWLVAQLLTRKKSYKEIAVANSELTKKPY